MPVPINEDEVKAYLKSFGWPKGLAVQLLKCLQKNSHRFYILDDSGSMMSNDGSMIVNGKTITCSRWAELGDAMKFHVNLAKVAGSKTEFRFLNQSQAVIVGDDPATDDAKVYKIFDVFNESPSGGTPLCKHIGEVKQKINALIPKLKELNERASLIICTDGEPSDGDIKAALNSLQGLPVDIVIRLCTNEDNIVEFWNSIDKQLEVTMDILDDWSNEAAEIYKINNWVNYSLPIQRFRECGVSLKEFDLLEESKLTPENLRRFLIALMGNGDLPNPVVNWAAFITEVDREVKSYDPLFNPVTKRREGLVNVAKIKSSYGPGGCCTIA